MSQLAGNARRQGHEHRGYGVTAMVEELAQRRGGVRASRLLPVDGVQTLVDEEAQGAKHTGPTWRSLNAIWAITECGYGKSVSL